MSVDFETVEGILGYAFKARPLLQEALTHPSLAGAAHYQRLEFLGDRVLGLVIADRLWKLFPTAKEGELANRYNALVRQESLAAKCVVLGLEAHILMSPGEEAQGGRSKAAIQADVMEALMGAIFLDGGLRAARGFIHRIWADDFEARQKVRRDAKSRLQEWAQKEGLGTPAYDIIQRSGPDHAPNFVVVATLLNGERAEGKGGSRRDAEQRAAGLLLDQVQGKHSG